MNEFTASNGYRVTPIPGGIELFNRHPNPDSGNVHSLGKYSVDALREFFRAEEDERLGRVRSTVDPDIVIYPVTANQIRVIDQAGHGNWATFDRDDADGLGPMSRTASAYFDAHPEPKPWTQARPGEVWSLGIGGGYHCESAAVVETPDGVQFVWGVKGNDLRTLPITDRSIDYGTRIYPEVS
jgi:hypothetical protein